MSNKRAAARVASLVVLWALLAGGVPATGARGQEAGGCLGDGDQACNVIEGFGGNAASQGSSGATIAGGGRSGFPNQVTGDLGAIGGGEGNLAGEQATVAGGSYNSALFFRAVVGGGSHNRAEVAYTTIAGGTTNLASGMRATVGGGAYNVASGVDSTVGGGSGNRASYRYATVGGGTFNHAASLDSVVAGGTGNTAGAAFTSVGGGVNNAASEFGGVVAGGTGNVASGGSAAIGGGYANLAGGLYGSVGGGLRNTAGEAPFATVAGGADNIASGTSSAVGGGAENLASGAYAAAPGGFANQAGGEYSFAAGRRARVSSGHAGAFLFADSSDFDFLSEAANELAARATGGVRFVTAVGESGETVAGVRLAAGSGSWETLSDRNAKSAILPADGRQLLERLAGLPINTWVYAGQPAFARHIGPMAQDFYAAFGFGQDERYIATVDADGVALAAIQGLYQLVQEKDGQLAAQQQRLAALEAEISAQRESLSSLEARLAELEQGQPCGGAAAASVVFGALSGWLLPAGIVLAGAAWLGGWGQAIRAAGVRRRA